MSHGWFVTNVRDARWVRSDKFGAAALFDVQDARFEELGINIRVLEPGQPASLYHAESAQEDFLVLRGDASSSSRARSGACAPGTSSTARR